MEKEQGISDLDEIAQKGRKKADGTLYGQSSSGAFNTPGVRVQRKFRPLAEELGVDPSQLKTKTMGERRAVREHEKTGVITFADYLELRGFKTVNEYLSWKKGDGSARQSPKVDTKAYAKKHGALQQQFMAEEGLSGPAAAAKAHQLLKTDDEFELESVERLDPDYIVLDDHSVMETKTVADQWTKSPEKQNRLTSPVVGTTPAGKLEAAKTKSEITHEARATLKQGRRNIEAFENERGANTPPLYKPLIDERRLRAQDVDDEIATLMQAEQEAVASATQQAQRMEPEEIDALLKKARETPGEVAKLTDQLLKLENGPTADEIQKYADAKYGADRSNWGALRMFRTQLLRQENQAFSKRDASGKASQDEQVKVLEDIKRRLADKVNALLRDEMENRNSGGYTPSDDDVKAVIELSLKTTQLGANGAHESWHAVKDLLRGMGKAGERVMAVIERASSKPETVEYLRSRMLEDGESVDSPAMEQLKDPEEREAYLFEYFIRDGGKMPVFPRARGMLSQLVQMLKDFVGITDDLIKTGNFFQFFDSGELIKSVDNNHSLLNALQETKTEQYINKLKAVTKPLRDLVKAAFGHAADRIKEMGNKDYTLIYEKLHVGGDGYAGFIPEWRARMMSFQNEYAAFAGNPAPQKISALVKKIESYKKQSGAEHDLGRETFPPTFTAEKLNGRLEEFREDVLKYGGAGLSAGQIETVINKILARGYSTAQRDWFRGNPEKMAKWTSEDVNQQAFAYINESTRLAELARAFPEGTSLEALLAKGDKSASPYQQQLIRTFIGAATGENAEAMNPMVRKLFGSLITAVNLSLLPFAVFSQMVEPLQLAYRKNDITSSMDAAFRGFRDLPRSFQTINDSTQRDVWEMIASDLGTISDAATVSAVSNLMNEIPMTGGLDKVNRLFFRYNGMEQWHRSMHVAATKQAIEYITENSNDAGKLKELGLTPGQVKLDDDGFLNYSDENVRAGILRYVNEALAHPDAGTNTMWMNDPRMALIAHLKRFTFGFAYHVNNRIVRDIKDGNLLALAPMIVAVPWMIGVDSLRDVFKPGDEPYKENWGVDDYLLNGIERAGLMGRYAIAMDAMRNMSYGGSGVEAISPTAEMTGSIARGVKEGDGWSALFREMPGHQLYVV
jgi:hypothetical protein